MAEPLTITVSAATLALLVERLFEYFVKPRIRTKEEQEKRGDMSGDKDPAFWQQEFRVAVLEVNKLQITPWLEKLTDAHEEVIKLLQERSAVFTRQTDLLQELVDANRRKRR